MQGRLSTLVSVISGVPQGTVLGPCLFLIHLLGISDNVSCETAVSSFADDTRLLRGVGSLRDCQSLQEDLSSLYSWASEVGMSFNAWKFEHLRFGSTEENTFQYLAPDGSIIKTKESLCNLGVMIDSNLSFTEQIDTANQSGKRWQVGLFVPSEGEKDTYSTSTGLLLPVVVTNRPVIHQQS